MLDVNNVKDDRQMKALTGLTLSEFCRLTESFRRGYQQHLDARHHAFYSPGNAEPEVDEKANYLLSKLNCSLYFTT